MLPQNGLAPKSLKEVHPVRDTHVFTVTCTDPMDFTHSWASRQSLRMMDLLLPKGRLHLTRSGGSNADQSLHSGCIVEYLIKKYGNGRFQVPADQTQKQLDDSYFSHFAEGESVNYNFFAVSKLRPPCARISDAAIGYQAAF